MTHLGERADVCIGFAVSLLEEGMAGELAKMFTIS